MTITVHIDTFKAAEQITLQNGRTLQRHTVEVTIGKDRRSVYCGTPWGEEGKRRMSIFGLAVRFSSGTKVWPGSATYWIDADKVNNLMPNIDKRGHFLLVGFADDFDGKAVRSQHNAVA